MKLRNCGKRQVLLALFFCAGMAAGSVTSLAGEIVNNESQAAPVSAIVAASSVVGTSISASPTFARVNGKPISARDYANLYNDTMRKRYYHAKPPENEELAARKEVADTLVERELLIEEAERRGIKVEEGVLERAVATLDRNNAAVAEWKGMRDVVLLGVKEQVTRLSLLDQITKILHEVPEATAEQVRAYYEQHPELFTEPEQLRLSVITLKVDPSSTNEVWAKAREEVKGWRERIVGGDDFAAMARKLSQDKSAARGGDLGYLHRGMLPEALSKRVDTFKVGEVSEPVTMLEGVSLFRVEDRIVPKLRDFAAVELRVRGLLKKEREENAWKESIAKLRGAARIEILIPLTNGGGQ